MEYEKKNLEYQNVKFEIKRIIDEDPEFFQFVGYGSTFGNVDRGQDVVVKGAFNDSLKRFTPKLLWQHDMEMPLGVFTEVYEDNIGLYVKGKMPKEDTFVSGRVIPQMKVGSIGEMSIGFTIDESDVREDDNGNKARFITKLHLWEVSLVTIPMNPAAGITDFKALDSKAAVPFQDLPFIQSDGEIDFDYKWDSSAAIERIKEFTNSTEKPSSSYKNAFLYYDSTESDKFGAYKLPIADIVDGKMVAVPRAIFAATATMKCDKSAIDLNESDEVKALNEYYNKMERPSPFEKGFAPLIDTFEKITDVSDLLKHVGFSNNETNSLIGSIKRFTKKQDDSEKNSQFISEFTSELKALSAIMKA